MFDNPASSTSWHALPELAGFDVPQAVGRLLDQPTLWWQALQLFVDHFADWEASWASAIGDDDREQRRVHALRSGAANVGAVALAAAAGQLEAVLLDRRAGQVAAVDDRLRGELAAVFRQSMQAARGALDARRVASEARS